MRVIHLPINLDRNITMPTNAFYIGSGIVNLPKSSLYMLLDETKYKSWLWANIKAKNNVYRELVTIKEASINGNDVILVCSCDKSNSCHYSTIIRKFLAYLIQQDKEFDSSNLTWPEFIAKFSVTSNDESLHNFCCWLYFNNHLEEQLNYNQLWLEYAQTNC